MLRYTSLLTMAAMSMANPLLAEDTSLEGLQERIVGQWTSMACELRPSLNQADPSLAPTPTYLKRDFTYDSDSGFEGAITVFLDPACELPAMHFDFAGDIVWHDPNPAIAGAWSQDYVLSKKLVLTVHAEPVAAQLNQLPEGACGEGPFEVGIARDVLGKPCILVQFVEGSEYVIDHDLLYVPEHTPNMLFMGGKHVDGTGFYFPEYRPMVGLQQPMIKVE